VKRGVLATTIGRLQAAAAKPTSAPKTAPAAKPKPKPPPP